MVWIVGTIAFVVVVYLFRNGRKNGDPLNRKAAAEICEYLVSTNEPEIWQIVSIYMENARYRKDARHIASMVPALLTNAGVDRSAALGTHKHLLEAANLVPR